MVLGLLALTFPVLQASAAGVSKCVGQGLCSSTATQVDNFNPSAIQGYFGADLGVFSMDTSLTGFQWNVTDSDYLQMKTPSVGATALSNSVVYYNNTETAWQMANGGNTVDIYFKQGDYSANVLIQAVLSAPEQVCIPFVAATIITQLSRSQTFNGEQQGLLPAIQAGNEVFSWSDIPVSYSPSWSINKLCVSLPSGTTDIDPLALDGYGHCFNLSAGSCSSTLSTANTPDIVVIEEVCDVGCSAPTFASLSGITLRAHDEVQSDNRYLYYYYGTTSGTLSGASFTCNGTASNYVGCVTFGISGANTGSPFDGHAGLPCANGGTISTSGSVNVDCTLSTSNANDFIFGLFAGYGGSSPSYSPLGSFSNVFFDTTYYVFAADYQVVSSTQASLATGWSESGTASNLDWEVVGDAIQQASAGPANYTFTVSATVSASPAVPKDSTSFAVDTISIVPKVLKATASLVKDTLSIVPSVSCIWSGGTCGAGRMYVFTLAATVSADVGVGCLYNLDDCPSGGTGFAGSAVAVGLILGAAFMLVLRRRRKNAL